MDINATFSYRLHNLRKMRGLSAQELCVKMGGIVTRQAVSKYENGKCMPDSKVLIALSDALGVRPDYFFRECEGRLEEVHYRKLSSLGAKDLKAVTLTVQDTVERILEAEDVSSVNRKFVPVLSDISIHNEKDAREAASILRAEWHVGKDAVSSVVSMLEDNGVIVVEVKAPHAFSGMNGTIEGGVTPVIVVNSGMTAERRRFTALHELGHALMHFGKEVGDKDVERLCNAFASEVLLPADVFIEAIGRKRHDIALVELRNLQVKYGMSIDALMYKAYDLGIISEKRHGTYWKKKNVLSGFKEEVEASVYDRESPSSRLENMVYRALAGEVVTASKAAELLKVPVEQVLHKFILA